MSYLPWKRAQPYSAGDKVFHAGNGYEAAFWSQAHVPGTPAADGSQPWKDLGPAEEAPEAWMRSPKHHPAHVNEPLLRLGASPYGAYFQAWKPPKGGLCGGSLSLARSGLDTGFAAMADDEFKKGLAALRARSPPPLIIASVGGATHGDWAASYNIDNIVAFVEDFHLDGLDIDYEPHDAFGPAPHVTDFLPKLAEQFRSRLPRPRYVLTLASMANGVETGNVVPMLKSGHLDMVAVMSYDFGVAGFVDYEKYIAAFSAHFPGRVFVGVQPGKEGHPGHELTLPEVEHAAAAVLRHPGRAGLFVWALQKDDGPFSADQVGRTATAALHRAGRGLGMAA
ncbi:glycoside hydrolase superfamily [Hyaloraphidium curvatum]|nr:glycoside hydrolase superfamily [Hyaloraphidium curvatum]